MSKPFLSIVTGLSGAGRSVALKALEDIGFSCIDNLPHPLVDQTIDYYLKNDQGQDLLAIGLDLKSKGFIEDFKKFKEAVSEKIETDIIFLTSDEQTLLRRFTTTRRKHPMLDGGGQLVAAVRREADMLESLQDHAEVTFDTSQWTPHFLARQLEARYKNRSPGRNLHVNITSFGFKYGILRPCDSLFDVRFLRNPYFDESLRDKTGLQSEVQNFVAKDPDFDQFFHKISDYLSFVLPRYHEEGKNYFRLGIGCTGGKHRSVTIAEKLGEVLSQSCGKKVLISVHHRDIPTL